jgi:hypothetical protein
MATGSVDGDHANRGYELRRNFQTWPHHAAQVGKFASLAVTQGGRTADRAVISLPAVRAATAWREDLRK